MLKRALLHEQVADVLREEVRSLHTPGQRLPSDAQQAKRFGVSIITLREAIRLLSTEGLVERKQGSGTYVCDQTRRHRVALVVREDILQGNPSSFFQHVTAAARTELQQRQYEVDLVMTGPDTEELPLPSDVAGVIAIHAVRQAPWLEDLKARGLPLVGSNSACDRSVGHDHEAFLHTGIEFLIQHGCTRIALLTQAKFGDERPDDYLAEMFAKHLTRRGLPFRPDWAASPVDATVSGNGWQRLHAIWNQDEQPDGLFVTDDTVFREAAMAILALGIQVPQELLVVTHANRGSDVFYPFPTARLENDPEAFGRALCEQLLAALNGDDRQPRHRILPHVWRGVEAVEAARHGKEEGDG